MFTTHPILTPSLLLLPLLLSPLLPTHAHPTTTTTTTLSRRYAPGACGMHITQYQKTEPGINPSPDYALDIILYDATQAEIGRVNKAPAPAGQAVGVTSQLPYVVLATTGQVDSDPIAFAYADQHWSSADGQCRFGAYDSGRRQGDCGFGC